MTETPEFDFSHEEEGTVLIQDLTDWDGDTDGMEAVESEWAEMAGQSHITASITEFGPQMSLGKETQNHLAREWTENADEAGIEKIALVSDGIKARAVSSNLDVSQDVRSFGSMDDAIEWARD